MTRLIDADELNEIFNAVTTDLLRKPELSKDVEHMVRAFIMTAEMISDAPTIDAMPVKHGKWITEEKDCIYGKKIRLKCSECGDTFDVSETAYPYERFCRYCGARMDEK